MEDKEEARRLEKDDKDDSDVEGHRRRAEEDESGKEIEDDTDVEAHRRKHSL